MPKKEFFKSSDYWDEWSETVPPFIEDFCIFVTSIDFNSTKGNIEIINPEIEISLVKIEMSPLIKKYQKIGVNILKYFKDIFVDRVLCL